MSKYLKKIFFLLFCVFLNSLFSQEGLSLNLQDIIKTAFTKKNPAEVSLFLEVEIKKLNSNNEKKIALSVLADYEERFDLFSRAGKHYLEAAELSPENERKSALTKAITAFLLADNISLASELCTSRLLPMLSTSFSEDDIKILTLFEWLKLKSEEEPSLEKIRKYVTDSKFKEFHPALLLTLWWIDGDKKAENTLLKKFPNSLEAGVVRGDTVLSPKTFWYLMPQTGEFKDFLPDSETVTESIAKPEEAGQNKAPAGQNQEPAAKFYQTGFFKTETFARGLADELKKKGFKVILKKEKRGKDSFFSVLVENDSKGNLVIRLKNEGYEAVPIFD